MRAQRIAMAKRVVVSRAVRLLNDKNSRLKVLGPAGKTARDVWIQFASKETPRMKNWDRQQISAFDTAHADAEIVK